MILTGKLSLSLQFSFEQKRAQFYIQGRAEALAVKNCSRKITMPNGIKVKLNVKTLLQTNKSMNVQSLEKFGSQESLCDLNTPPPQKKVQMYYEVLSSPDGDRNDSS